MKSLEDLNVIIDVYLFLILFLTFIERLVKYVSKTEISLEKINHLPIGKKEIYFSFLLADLLSFRNLAYFFMLGIIFRFLIVNYGFYAIFSIFFLFAFYISILIWIRDLIIILDNFFSKRKIKNALGAILGILASSFIILSFIGERMDLESNPQKIIAVFSYLPFGWAGNGIISLISQSIGQGLIYLLLLLSFALAGVKIGVVLVKKKKFG
ncbi:MAG: hypothetical protein KAU46_05120 [Candidatus Aminicenantes bacterium]|nr:hypothetical protein [Candidatus Aminicenantes bacterium]